MASIQKRPNGKWRARYRDESGKEHARHFARKIDAQRWLDEETARLVTGNYVEPKLRKVTVDEWCDRWLEGYGSRRPSTVRQAKTHLAQIRKEFGPLPLSAVRPSMVKTWVARLAAEGFAKSYVYALHARLSQVMTDAVIDGLIPANPCSRRTSPGEGKSRPYLATEEQVWALYDLAADKYKGAILLGAFAGLRLAEACGLRIEDVHFLRREIHPAVQYPAEPLKTEMSREAIPIADALVTELSRLAAGRTSGPLLTDDDGGQLARGRSNGRCGASAGRCPASPRGSGSTTCGTSTRRC